MKSNLRNEIKSYIVRSGCTMQEVVDQLSEDYGWSDSVSNLSNKLQRESLLCGMWRRFSLLTPLVMTLYGRNGPNRNPCSHQKQRTAFDGQSAKGCFR